MHAMVGIFKMDTKFFDRQRQELNERIVPFVKHQPGFVRRPGPTIAFSDAAIRSRSSTARRPRRRWPL